MASAPSSPASPAPFDRIAASESGDLEWDDAPDDVGVDDRRSDSRAPAAFGAPAAFRSSPLAAREAGREGLTTQQPEELAMRSPAEPAGRKFHFIPGPATQRFFEPQLASGSAAACPPEVAGVINDSLSLHILTDPGFTPRAWDVGHSAEGKPTRGTRPPAQLDIGHVSPDALPDRLARFWRGELRIEQGEGPVPDLVPLLEGALGVQVIVARVAGRGAAEKAAREAAPGTAAEQPVCAALTVLGTRFLFVNAARPVALQRFALAHALAHLLLNHGDVVDERIEWNRNNPLEASANDFAEELLAPVSAVRSWYERRGARADGPRLQAVTVATLIELANAFGITAWAALYRSRAAQRLHPKQFATLRHALRAGERHLLARQAFLGGLRDTLATLTPDEAAPPGAYGPPAVLRVPGPMRERALTAVRERRLSLEEAAQMLRVPPQELAQALARLGIE
jgi:hypothetical protein